MTFFFYTAMGTSMTLASFSYALNSYFTTKRGRAMSLAVTIIGLGPIIVPQITTVLISYYGFQVFLNIIFSIKIELSLRFTITILVPYY